MRDIDVVYNKIRTTRYVIRSPSFQETWNKHPEDHTFVDKLIESYDSEAIKAWIKKKQADSLGAKTHKELRVIALRMGFTGIKGFNKATLLSLIQETLDARRDSETSSGNENSDTNGRCDREEIQQAYPRFISQVGHSD